MLHLSDYITTELHKECMKQMKLRLGRVRMKLSLKLLTLRLNVALAIIVSAPNALFGVLNTFLTAFLY